MPIKRDISICLLIIYTREENELIVCSLRFNTKIMKNNVLEDALPAAIVAGIIAILISWWISL